MVISLINWASADDSKRKGPPIDMTPDNTPFAPLSFDAVSENSGSFGQHSLRSRSQGSAPRTNVRRYDVDMASVGTGRMTVPYTPDVPIDESPYLE
eukprot:TRINITY_DN51062_c0_g1_i1.p1 TRINITY_DN51062_c0_g1~~TRINITY_DN51062_c0_g1_i1.p1  ORF type:complete len:109 (+),score=16.37 TRINITY_DN51062_c0_g1_i1:41-328(+)